MIECAVWWAQPLPNESRFLVFLDALEQGRHSAYRKEIDQRRFLTGRVLAKTVLAEKLGLTAETLTFDATCEDCGKPHGKPRLPGIEFSVSHSGDRIGLAVSTVPVGLDVETDTRRAEDSLIAYALNETEQKTLAALPPEERIGTFFQYWSRKEALMKATGRGLKIPLHSITLSGAELVESTHEALHPATTRLADLDPGEGYRGAVAAITTEELKVTENWWHPA